MKLIRYEGENVTPSDDAILYRTFLSDGLFETVTPTFTSGAITIPAMRGVMCGRDFTTDAETLTAVLASSGTITGQIYMWIDMEDETYPLSIKIRNSVGSLSDDDINNGGQYYGLEIAQYTANTSAVTGVILTCPIISLPAKDDWQSTYATLTYASADSPTFVANTSIDLTDRISVGMKLKLTQSTVKYFIVTAITSTTITLYGGTDYVLLDSTITDVYFSSVKAPLGFPLDVEKWTVTASFSASTGQTTAVANTWYNLNTALISVPIGYWNMSYFVVAQNGQAGSAVDRYLNVTLSTANNSQSNAAYSNQYAQSECKFARFPFQKSFPYSTTSKTSLYLNTMTNTNADIILNMNDETPAIIKAVCAYL